LKCKKCGADNPDSAEFCSLCMERIREPGEAGFPARHAAPDESYVAPGEWRGDAEILRPTMSKVVQDKVRKFRSKMVVYGIIIVLIIAWLVLSFTVWGNPSPGARSNQLIDAINNRNPDAYLSLFQEKDIASAKVMYSELEAYLGGAGSYTGVKLKVDQPDVYDARSYLEGGTIELMSGRSISITRADNLMIVLENHGGKWFVVPEGTNLVP
jgi:hypothetical protein